MVAFQKASLVKLLILENKCPQCKCLFLPIKAQKYCSARCRGLNWYYKHCGAKPKQHICEQCGKEFVHKFKKVRFCSRNCGLSKNRHSNVERTRAWGRQNYWNNRDHHLKTQANYRARSGINAKRIKSGDAAFNALKQRCSNPNNKSFKYYGGKGVQCLLSKKEFKNIYFRTAFCERCNVILSDFNRKIGRNSRTIDRIDSSKNYEVNNIQIICRSCQSKRVHEKYGKKS